MADPLQSTAPIPPAGGNPPNRQPGRGAKEPPPRQERPAPRAADRVSVHGGRLFGLQMLRERVLAHTRGQLELPEHVAVPVFAEVPEDETVGEFLGRLLSAQNQLAAQRAGQWDAGRLRRCVDAGLRGGADRKNLLRISYMLLLKQKCHVFASSPLLVGHCNFFL